MSLYNISFTSVVLFLAWTHLITLQQTNVFVVCIKLSFHRAKYALVNQFCYPSRKTPCVILSNVIHNPTAVNTQENWCKNSTIKISTIFVIIQVVVPTLLVVPSLFSCRLMFLSHAILCPKWRIVLTESILMWLVILGKHKNCTMYGCMDVMRSC